MVRLSIARVGVTTIAAALVATAFSVAPVWAEAPMQSPAQEPPIQTPARLSIGSTVVVPAPCRLTHSDQLTYEFSPLFQSPTYFIQFLRGPAANDGSVRLQIPANATPGRYALRGTCSIVRPDGELTYWFDQYATIDPAEVELIIGPGSARAARPGYTG